MSRVADDQLQAGREAARRHAWREAYDLLKEVASAQDLPPEDLETLGEAAYWTGRLDDVIDARERAYAAYVEQGNRSRAAIVALDVASDYEAKLSGAIAKGWYKRALRLLKDEPESLAHGYLARAHRIAAVARGNLDEALEHAKREVEIATRFGDHDLLALGLHDQGRIRVQQGQVEEGLALIDEATVPAVSGELSPLATGTVYCLTISICQNLAEYRRAGEWTEAAKRWCERQAIAGFPGLCRVYRAEIMRLRGEWAEAEQEAKRACAELSEWGVLSVAGDAFYELGEIRMRVGDIPAAEEAFRQAHELGRHPQPGLALLRLAEGKVDAAAAGIKRALKDEALTPLERARFLPAQVEIAVTAGDLETARMAAGELEEIAQRFGTVALEAQAVLARGRVQLAEADSEGAVRSLRRSWQLWQEVDAPYDAARARLHLGVAYRGEDDEEAATLELEAVKATFERLGAMPDARKAAALLGVEPTAVVERPRVRGRRTTKTFMFTDIVRSTPLVEAIGDEAWAHLIQWHDQTLRALFARHGGEEVDHTGDGFFVAFDTPPAAVECAVDIQRTLAEHRRTHGFAPQLRVGLHATPATRRGLNYSGKGVHQAARIAAQAEGDEILASQDVLSAAGPVRFGTAGPRTLHLKGLSRPVEVVAIRWR